MPIEHINLQKFLELGAMNVDHDLPSNFVTDLLDTLLVTEDYNDAEH